MCPALPYGRSVQVLLSRKLTVLMVAALMAVMMIASVGVASADPVNAPKAGYGTLVCGNTTHNVVSAGNRTLIASDTDSNSQVLIILDKAPAFPQNQLTECVEGEFLEVHFHGSVLVLAPRAGYPTQSWASSTRT
jgi:hypothetical protein